MNASIGTWLLGGALIASLSWNAMRLRRPEAPALDCDGGSCADAAERLCDLDLDPAQRDRLRGLLLRCEEEEARRGARAEALSRELMALLRDPAADVATIRERARELGALRASSVEDCVESSLALRQLLTPQQAGRVLDACCDGKRTGG